jgi:hypothetical protein
VNAYASLLLAAYIVAVLMAGNESRLADEIKKEGDFLVWAAALIIVIGVADYLGEAGRVFVFMVFVAMALVAVKRNPTIFDNLAAVLRLNRG